MSDARLLIDTLRIASAGDPGVLARKWAAADVEALLQLSEREGAVLWLHRRLKMLGITLEAAMRERLTNAAKLAAAKLLRLDDETAKVLTLLANAGVVVVPLKGAALRRISARVPYTDARTPADIDLLCQSGDAARAFEVLRSAGYSPVQEHHSPDHHHLVSLCGAAGIGIELHLTTETSVPPHEAWRRANADGVTFRLDGRSIPLPGDTELLWHALAHALVTAELDARNGTRLRFFLDAAALLATDAVNIDWKRVRERIDSEECRHRDLARAWLMAASTLAGRAIPHSALGPTPFQPLNLERLLSWRLTLQSQPAPQTRWTHKLHEEGARGEFKLPLEPAHGAASPYARTRHMIASGCARFWWSVSAV